MTTTTRTPGQIREAGLSRLVVIGALFDPDTEGVELALKSGRHIDVVAYSSVSVEQCQAVADALGLTRGTTSPSNGFMIRRWDREADDDGFAINMRSFRTGETVHTGPECECGQVHSNGLTEHGEPRP